MNLNDYDIGESLVDSGNFYSKVIDKSENSILMYLTKRTKKGINTTQWFSLCSDSDQRKFTERFKKYL